jgi:hypothetical protein
VENARSQLAKILESTRPKIEIIHSTGTPVPEHDMVASVGETSHCTVKTPCSHSHDLARNQTNKFLQAKEEKPDSQPNDMTAPITNLPSLVASAVESRTVPVQRDSCEHPAEDEVE